jgi:DNA-binding MarR family transcriptional regulator
VSVPNSYRNGAGPIPADETVTIEQGKAIASLLLSITRRLFAGDHDPAEELPLAQLRVCGILHDGRRPMSTISRELRVSLSAMTQIADRLERAGLVERVSEGTDRRVRCLQLTERGEEMMRAREEARVRRVQAVLEGLLPETRNEVLASLKTLVAACVATKDESLLTEKAGR